MVKLTERAEELIEQVQKMREAHEEIMRYCTGECIGCPIHAWCNDQYIDYNLDFFDSVETWADFIDHAEKYDRAHEEDEEYDAWDHACTWAGVPHSILDIRKR